ncbi:MAG: MerR family transcriptional regulator [Candidatus Fermentibacteraceae bacterium]|nr:MerR family transcriptional regulator [Candidatus Fermentibacteraceae bacterium]MBN2609260.1 MerR family transcriptional regulator [Candidatus Fermentibacteraceae bacterium]
MESGGKLYYSISEVCSMTGLKPHVLRYWETAFPMLKPSKNQSGNRVYKEGDIGLIKLISRLLYRERYTIDGARQKIEEMDDLEEQMELELSTATVSFETMDMIKREISELIDLLDRDPMAVDKQED